ncbi:MAG TPA: GNAT family protein [Actinoplanes sp.]|nr:GNAT family protein [Actinoplanes sp.]
MSVLNGDKVVLRPATAGDVPELAVIRANPKVFVRWRGTNDLDAEIAGDLADPSLHLYAIEADGAVVGAIQWAAEEDPDYRHASLDIYLDPTVHGRGLGTDAVRTLAKHLVDHHAFHRLVIDPAADNAPAIACYGKVGFRPVGVMRSYEREPDGTWHDNLLMDLLAGDLIR